MVSQSSGESVRQWGEAPLIGGRVPAQSNFRSYFSGSPIETMRYRLSQTNPQSRSKVIVIESDAAADLIRRYSDGRPDNSTVHCYRVCIFFSNGQNARNEGMAVREAFQRQYPAIPAYFSYDGTAWLLTVGNCLSMDELLVMLNALSRRWPQAYTWQGRIPLTEFIEAQEIYGGTVAWQLTTGPLPQEETDTPEEF
jgi:hypothetical protein